MNTQRQSVSKSTAPKKQLNGLVSSIKVCCQPKIKN